MKRMGLLMCCLGMMSMAVVEGRTWTATDGRTLEAEFVSTDGTSVVVKRASDRREFTLALAKLSEEDQKWVKEEGERLYRYFYSEALS